VADRPVLSEGHACPVIYAAVTDLGIAIGLNREHWQPMTREDALRLRDIPSELDGHPNPAVSLGGHHVLAGGHDLLRVLTLEDNYGVTWARRRPIQPETDVCAADSPIRPHTE
jgi:hypothetical protein